MATPLVTLRGITKTYDNGGVTTPVLRGVDLVINQGEFVALMGPSGSGKSTLMHILGLLDRADSGAYVLRTDDVTTLDTDEQARMRNARIGFVFQAFHLLPRLTARENVMLPLMYAGVPMAERTRRADEALRRVGLGERLTYRPTQLSGGQKQRVAIARALVNDPDIIFADEPTGNLDSISSEQVLGLLGELHKEGRTIVMVTHEPDAAAVAERIIRMKDGKIENA